MVEHDRPLALIALLLLGLATVSTGASAPPPSDPSDGGVQFADVIVRSHVVIRVRTVQARAPVPLASMFREKKGPRCIATNDMVGAAVIAPNAVDIVLRTGERVRARFAASCPALDYYSGFYLAPTADAKLCARRDVVRDRAGGECAVERIRMLTPRR